MFINKIYLNKIDQLSGHFAFFVLCFFLILVSSGELSAAENVDMKNGASANAPRESARRNYLGGGDEEDLLVQSKLVPPSRTGVVETQAEDDQPDPANEHD